MRGNSILDSPVCCFNEARRSPLEGKEKNHHSHRHEDVLGKERGKGWIRHKDQPLRTRSFNESIY